VVVEHDLEVLVRLDFCPLRVVARVGLRVHVDDLAVSLVLEEQTGLVVRDDLEVGRGV